MAQAFLHHYKWERLGRGAVDQFASAAQGHSGTPQEKIAMFTVQCKRRVDTRGGRKGF